MQQPTGTRSRQVRNPQPTPGDLLLAVGSSHPKFWLLVWLKDLHRYTTLEALALRAAARRARDPLTFDALCAAWGHFEQETRKNIERAQRAGLLPLCWEGTRAMDDVGVAA